MQRRHFLQTIAAAGAITPMIRAADLPDDLKVTRVVGFDLVSQRIKLAGKNARRGVHGRTARDRMVRLYTNMGIEAVGRCWKPQEVVAKLLGTNPLRWLDPRSPRFTSPLERRTMVLWDLAGKVLGKPVYELLGCSEPRKVPVYDGSIYFADLLPEYASRWQDRFKEEVDMSLALGHRAFKIKVGRGYKWMDRREGDLRDVDVVRTIRQHAGDEVLLGADANNGYDLEGEKQFLDRTAELRLAFFEEPLPEQVEQCLELKQFIADHKLQTLLADGEGQHDLEAYRPFVRSRAVDILQGDMNSFGIELTMAEAAMAQPYGIRIAPHNWSSLLGFYQQLHVAMAVPNFYRAEHDPLSTNVLVADGYKIEDGRCRVPDAPGFGLVINERAFERVKINFDLRE